MECDACAKLVNEVRNVAGALVCLRCESDIRTGHGDPQIQDIMDKAFSNFEDDPMADTERWPSDEDRDVYDAFDNPEACPGCGCLPGDGATTGCDDPLGCGAHKLGMDDAMADTQRHVKHESAKFDGDAYMEETIRIEESRKRQNKAPVERESVGHIRQLRTQENPNNRIRIGK